MCARIRVTERRVGIKRPQEVGDDERQTDRIREEGKMQVRDTMGVGGKRLGTRKEEKL